MTDQQVLTAEIARTLVGRRVRLSLTFDAPTRRRGVTERRTVREVGTIVRDDRTAGERFMLRKSKSCTVIAFSLGYVLDAVGAEQTPASA